MSAPKFRVSVRLSGQDGNAFNLMGLVIRALREAGASEAQVKEFQTEAMSADYDHLLRTCAAWVEVS